MSIREYLHLSAISQLLVTLLRWFFHFSSLQPKRVFWTTWDSINEQFRSRNLANHHKCVAFQSRSWQVVACHARHVTRMLSRNPQNWSRDETGDSNQYFTTVLNSYQSFQARGVTDSVSLPLIGHSVTSQPSDWLLSSPLMIQVPGLKVMVTQWSQAVARACKCLFLWLNQTLNCYWSPIFWSGSQGKQLLEKIGKSLAFFLSSRNFGWKGNKDAFGSFLN